MALAVGALLIGLGLHVLRSAGLLTSGLSGVAALVHYATDWNLGAALFALNLPFYALAWRTLGPVFTLKSLAVVALISSIVDHAAALLTISQVHAPSAGLAGGVLIGIGLLARFRHGASVGGTSSLALYLQQRHGWRAGRVLMAIDVAIFATALAVLDPRKVAWSAAGAVVLNLLLALNHRPGRYLASAQQR